MWPLITSLITLFLLSGNTHQTESETGQALELFRQNKFEMALPLLERAVAKQKDDADLHAWLAETYRRLGKKEEAVKEAGHALQLDSCHSFAHTVMAEASRRCHWAVRSDTDTTWVHLKLALECDSLDGNVWLSIWDEAILRENFELMHKSIRKMRETDFLTITALSFGRWMLRTLPKNAILITNGDMDTYPLLAVQETETFRPDVVVIERGILGTRQFQHYLSDSLKIPLPFSDSQLDSLLNIPDMRENLLSISEQIFHGWIDQKKRDSFTRPVAIATTVDEGFYDDVANHLVYGGPYFVWQANTITDTIDISLIERSLAGIKSDDFTGPWISDQDRSPVRWMYTKYLANNITAMAITLGDELIKSERFNEALVTLDWAEEFERSNELGPVFTDRIAYLKENVNQQITAQDTLPDDYLPFALQIQNGRLAGKCEYLEGFTISMDIPGELLENGLIGFDKDALISLIKNQEITGTLTYPDGKTTPIKYEIVRHRGPEEIYMKTTLGYFLWEYVQIEDNKLIFAIYWWYCPPAREADLEILEMTEQLLADSTHWHQNDDRNCDDDIENNYWSLFCALKHASLVKMGEYNHHNTAMQTVRFVIDDLVPDHEFRHPLMDYNNAPSTQHRDILTLLEIARQRIKKELEIDKK